VTPIPSDLKYTHSHEWVREEDDGSVTVGISDPMQAMLGDILFVELPELGQEVKALEEIGIVESVSESIEICAPLSGEITEINELLKEKPELINLDAYHDGWIFKMMPYDPDEIKDMLDSEAYEEVVEADEL